MEKVIIDGGVALNGNITVSGMKNAAVAVLFASVLVGDTCVIENLPDISDVDISLEILKSVGVKVERIDKNSVKLDSSEAMDIMPPEELAKKMRASYYLIGASLGRFGHSRIAYPGGCDFGVRPIDQHVKAFNALGADVVQESHIIEATARGGRLKGSSILFDCATVGGTMNAIMAAVLADGSTIIENAAKEPHIIDLANFLNICGANITNVGTDTIKIKGVEKLHGGTYELSPDMIEAGTYMVAAAATGGDITVENVIPKHLETISLKLREMGVEVYEDEFNSLVRVRGGNAMSGTDVQTRPYPGFPTDMHPQMAVLLCMANGESSLTDTVWDNRFRYVEELKRMGADITVENNTAYFRGNTVFTPARVRAVDLRAGAAMIVAGLAAKGQTEIEDFFYVERGYEGIIEKLRSVGAHIIKIN